MRRRRTDCQRSVGSVPGGCATADPGRRPGGLTVFGYHSRYLRIDLTIDSATSVPLSADVLRRFLGGVGLGTWILHRESAPGVHPLAAEAPFVFAFSPLVGTPLTTSAKF